LAWKELGLAQEHAADASAVEQALIEALSHRYANPQPEDRGPLDQAYADAMRTSHIDIRIGHWYEAITANLKAAEADRRYRVVFGEPKGLIVFYAAHNQHMLAYAAMMTGQRDLAIEHIRAMVKGMPEEEVKEHAAVAEAFIAVPYEVLIRFGQWDEILAEPDHPEFMVFTRAFRHAARGIAYAAKNDVKSGRAEQTAFLEASKLVPVEETFGNNPCRALLAVANSMLEGEILIREGKLDQGLSELRTAVDAEDALHYDEPPGWILPVRHSLGANLMQAGRFAEAEQVYRDDLARLPENGWSLFGLARSLELQQKNDEAAAVEARFQKIWSGADVQITSSCLCQSGELARKNSQRIERPLEQ